MAVQICKHAVPEQEPLECKPEFIQLNHDCVLCPGPLYKSCMGKNQNCTLFGILGGLNKNEMQMRELLLHVNILVLKGAISSVLKVELKLYFFKNPQTF